ncbi:MAG: hypothetical protein OHK0023_02570 [Anaerolineae bacterium]
MPPTSTVNYVTVIEPVLEVTLIGTAEYARWRDLLNDEGLAVDSTPTQANILISAVDSKFRGIRFQEVSVSVMVGDARYFLAHAYNSIAWFALAERVLFRTPYYQGTITVNAQHIRLSRGQAALLDAKLPTNAPHISAGERRDEFLIHLPKKLRRQPNQPHYFHARLEGHATVFAADNRLVQITPTADERIWQLIKASRFQVDQWLVRATARHSKSKTYTEA